MADNFGERLANLGQAFSNNIKEIKLQRSIGRANEFAQAIKASEADEQQKRAELRKLSETLTMELAQYGAPGQLTQQVAQAISPPQRFAQTADQVLLNPDEFTDQQEEAAMGIREQAVSLEQQKISGVRQEAQQKRAEKLDQRTQDKILRTGERLSSVAKKNIEAYDQASTLIDLLEANNPLADNAVPTFAARATGEVGNLTEAERAAFGGSKAIQRKLARWAKAATTGKLTDADRGDLLKLSKILQKGAARGVRKKAGLLSKQLGSVLDLDPSEIENQILPPSFLEDAAQSPQEAPGAAPQQPAAVGTQAPSIPGLRFK